MKLGSLQNLKGIKPCGNTINKRKQKKEDNLSAAYMLIDLC